MIVQNNDGYTNFTPNHPAGTYYVWEEQGTCVGYKVNPSVMAVSVENGVNKTVNLNTAQMKEPILDDPVGVLVEKSFSDWNKDSK